MIYLGKFYSYSKLISLKGILVIVSAIVQRSKNGKGTGHTEILPNVHF